MPQKACIQTDELMEKLAESDRALARVRQQNLRLAATGSAAYFLIGAAAFAAACLLGRFVL
jgi:hypothetical protein